VYIDLMTLLLFFPEPPAFEVLPALKAQLPVVAITKLSLCLEGLPHWSDDANQISFLSLLLFPVCKMHTTTTGVWWEKVVEVPQ
jgi:hypothetical protein